MQSKKSFFNVTLFRKNLTRFWPLWGGLSIAGAFIPLFMVLEIATSSNRHLSPDDFADLLYTAVTMFAPAFIMGYAVLCAILIWNYLYSSRAVGLMHTLPVSRTCLFVTNTLSGLAIMAIPFAVTGGLLSLAALFFGMFNALAVAQTVTAVVCMAVLFFGLATLCAMLTGHAAVLPVLYLLVNFLAEIIECMVAYLNSTFLMGLTIEIEGHLLFLSPVLNIYSRFRRVSERIYFGNEPHDWEWEYDLVGLGTVALYALAGIALLVLAWLLYQRRQSERAGDIVAYRPLRPVFRYGVALMSALTLGQLLNGAFWSALHSDVAFGDFVPMTICMMIAGVIGYYIASMLLEKSLRVFKGSWKGVLMVCAAVVILCAGVRLDIMGLEHRIPSVDDIERVSIYGSMDEISFDTGTEEGRKQVAQVVDIHQAILADKEYIRTAGYDLRTRYDDENERTMISSVCLDYELKNGSNLRRYYTLPFTEERMKDADTYDSKIYQLTHSEDALTQNIRIPEGSLLRINVYANGGEMKGGDGYERIYNAILQDAKEGHLSRINFPYWERVGSDTQKFMNCWMEILYTVQRDGQSEVVNKGVDLMSDMTHTIDALLAEGYFTREQLQSLEDGTFRYDEHEGYEDMVMYN